MNRCFLVLILLTFCVAPIQAQDKIIKTNGDTVLAKVLEVGPNAISYKKASMPEGATFTEMKSDIRMIIFANGTIENISQTGSNDQTTTTISINSQGQATTNTTKKDQKNKIELKDGKYYINGQKASLKEVDKMLGTSKNPAILLPLKAAKAMGTGQKIAKITSIPTTIIGGSALLVKTVDLINDIRRTRDHTSTYTGFFTSVFATFSLPITNKILKKQSDKMHGKLIDMYNVTN